MMIKNTICLFILLVPFSCYGQDKYNYIRSTVMLNSSATRQTTTVQYYDGLDRLKTAKYAEDDFSINEDRYNETMQYDMNGNITHLTRTGMMQAGSYGVIDDLSMTYVGNQLSAATDAAAAVLREGSLDFKGSGSCAYVYNGNGALVSDQSRGIAKIDYDTNNNPRRIQFVDGNVTKYVYSASGQKLRTIHYTADSHVAKVAYGQTHELTSAEIMYADSTDYLLDGSLILENGRISKYLFGEGYCQAKPAGGPTDTFAFYFYNKDHLGNIREVVSQSGAICQLDNYYPFGTPYSDPSAAINPKYQPYKYNGKELDLMHGLNTYDYGARQYNLVLPVWDRVDPLAEKYYDISPYVYCVNNPVRHIDPNGKEVREGSGAYCAENASIKKLANYLAIHDDPNSIMILAHGIYNKGDRFASEINIQTYNFKTKEWQNNFITNGKQLYVFLILHSKTWKKFMNGKIDPSNLHIVFYSCGSSSLIRKFSSFSAFKDIAFIAPDRKLRILNNNETEISDEVKDNYNNHIRVFGTWRTFKNGKEPMINGNYNGNNKPGTKGFKYESTFFYR